MNLTKFNINLLAFFAFLFIFPLDFISYTLGSIKSIDLPVGLVGYTLGVLSIGVFCCLKKFRVSDFYMICLIGAFLIPISFSSNAESLDYFYWVKTFSVFFVGMMMYDYLKQENSIFTKKIVSILFVVMFTLISIYSPDGNYLRLADAFIVASLFVISSQKRFIITLLTVTLSVIALYKIGSRAGLIFFSVIAVILIYIKYGFWKFSILFPLVLYYTFQTLTNLNSTITNYHDNRLLRLIFSRDTDTSLNSRAIFNETGYDTFLKNPITGDFAYYRPLYGEGAYAHNYLSYLAEFGVIGVLFLFVFLVYFIYFVVINKKIKSDYYLFIFSMGLLSILGLATAKSYYWIIPFLTFGLIYRAVSAKNYWRNYD